MKLSVRYVLILLFIAVNLGRGADEKRAYAAGKFGAWVDGVRVDYLKTFEGGELVGVVSNEPAVGTAPPKKHIVSTASAPVRMQISLNLQPGVKSWINEFAAGGRPHRTLVIARYDFNDVGVRAMTYPNAELSEVIFPRLAGDSKDAAYLTLVIAPGAGTSVAPPPYSGVAVKLQSVLQANFGVRAASLPTARVASVEAVSMKRGLVGGSPSGPIDFPNLVMEVSAADETAWLAWRDSFLGQGNSSDTDEISVSIDFLPPDLKPPALLTLNFSHVGLVRVESNKMEVNSEKIQRITAELYYEGFALTQSVTLANAPIGVASAPTPTAAPSPTPRPEKPDVFAVGKPSAEDKGAKDPANFPRPEGVVRKSYTSVQQKGAVQEIVVYQAMSTFDAAEQFYVQQLTDAGWTSVSRFEDNNAVGNAHQLGTSWKSPSRSVSITLTEVKKGIEVTVKLSSTVTPKS